MYELISLILQILGLVVSVLILNEFKVANARNYYRLPEK